MLVLILVIIGAIIGVVRARQLGGKPGDLWQYGAVYGLIGGLIGVIASIVIMRLG